MLKCLIALAVLSATSAPAMAQNAPAPNAGQQQAAAKPQTVKKRVCQVIDENPYSRLGSRKICKTVEVPVQPSGGQSAQQTAAPSSEPKGN